MQVHIKIFNYSAEPTDFFSLSADVGTIDPDTISYAEAISGKIISLSNEDAASVTIANSSSESETVNINKSVQKCFQTSAVNYITGNTRPTNEDGTDAPFRTSEVDPIIVENIFDLNVGDKFSLQIFEDLIEFTIFRIDVYSTNEIKVEASKQVGGIYSFLQLFKNSETGKIYFIYKDFLNTGWIHYSSETSQMEEWAPYENFIICA